MINQHDFDLLIENPGPIVYGVTMEDVVKAAYQKMAKDCFSIEEDWLV